MATSPAPDPTSLRTISALSLFVDDLPAAKTFYASVFPDAPVLFEDTTSCALSFSNLIVNLLVTSEAAALVQPHPVGGPDAGRRFQISVWVRDLEVVFEKLILLGVDILTGPTDQPWGIRTVTFVDPAGHSWEVGQRLEDGMK